MRSIFPGASAGNANLKGKKTKTLSCQCCDLRNFKDEELLKEHEKEIQYYIGISSNGRTADSDSVNLGSSPSIPAKLEERDNERETKN